MKNIIVGIFTLIIAGTMFYVASQGRAYHGGQHGKVIQDLKDVQGQNTKIAEPESKDDRKIEQDKLKALKDKAGNVGAFKVSSKYKSKCASCHGVNGRGIMGPALIGQSSEKVYKDLVEFKSGRRENTVMRGLLISLDEKDLKELADEIGEFEQRAKALSNK